MARTIRQYTAEIRENNIRKGFRPAAGGPGDNTWGDYIALLHSEVSEALEAYRDHRLADATDAERWNSAGLPKPEGVGSELADVAIRLLDMADVFGISPSGYERLADLHDHRPLRGIELSSFGDHITWLHYEVSGALLYAARLAIVLRVLVRVAGTYGFDLDAEIERKIAYNATRPYQHGGRTVADGVMQAPVIRNIEKETKNA